MFEQAIACKRVGIYMDWSVNPLTGQESMSTATTYATPGVKLWIIPGKIFRIEHTIQGPEGKPVVIVKERPMGPFGWEYEKLE